MSTAQQDRIAAILDGDALYRTEVALLNAKHRKGEVADSQYGNIRKWLVASALARNRRQQAARARQPFNPAFQNVHTVAGRHVAHA